MSTTRFLTPQEQLAILREDFGCQSVIRTEYHEYTNEADLEADLKAITDERTARKTGNVLPVLPEADLAALLAKRRRK